MAVVFAYGSLVAARGRAATLPGHRRTWGVAMDNAVAVPGYKRYRDPTTGGWPDVRVAFLDLVPDAGASVDGLALDVADAALAALDARERNYARARVRLADGTPAWCYLGSAEGRARAQRAPVVAVCAYLELVRGAHAALAGSPAHFDATTDAPPPLADLERVDLPPAA